MARTAVVPEAILLGPLSARYDVRGRGRQRPLYVCAVTRLDRASPNFEQAIPKRASAVEVLAHHAIEVKNVVRAEGATWGLKAWFDLSGDDSAGGVEGGGGGQRIAFRRPHP